MIHLAERLPALIRSSARPPTATNIPSSQSGCRLLRSLHCGLLSAHSELPVAPRRACHPAIVPRVSDRSLPFGKPSPAWQELCITQKSCRQQKAIVRIPSREYPWEHRTSTFTPSPAVRERGPGVRADNADRMSICGWCTAWQERGRGPYSG